VMEVQAPTAVSQIADGQVQAPTGVSQISDGQVQAPTGVSQIGDGQVQAATGVSQIGDGQAQAATAASAVTAACPTGSLTLTLEKGQLKDSKGRFGYIASNSQFQFDNPVQAGGKGQDDWTLCSNSTLANQGSSNFWKCNSGAGFYNLYNTDYNPGACTLVNFIITSCS